MNEQIAGFVDLVVSHPNRAPRWWRRLMCELAGDILRRRALLDAAEPFQELQRIRRAA